MRSAILIIAGILLLGAFAAGGWRLGGGPQSTATAAKVFLPLWLAAASINLWLGASGASDTVAAELSGFLLIFGLPAAAAAFVWWRFS